MNDMPPRPLLKVQARWRMGQAMGTCLTLAGALVALELLMSVFQLYTGGAIPVYFWDTAAQNIQTGLSLGPDGFYAALRMEEAGMGLTLAITQRTAAALVITQLLTTVVVAPLKLGALENLYTLARGAVPPFRMAVRWYEEPKRAARAILTELILLVCQAALDLVLALPGLAVIWMAGGDLNRLSTGVWLVAAAYLLGYCIMTQLAPVRYLLACAPEAGVAAAFRETFQVLKGRRTDYLVFRLSFLVMEILASLTQGLFNFYLFPYRGLSNFLWLDAVRGRSIDVTAPPVPLGS